MQTHDQMARRFACAIERRPMEFKEAADWLLSEVPDGLDVQSVRTPFCRSLEMVDQLIMWHRGRRAGHTGLTLRDARRIGFLAALLGVPDFSSALLPRLWGRWGPENAFLGGRRWLVHALHSRPSGEERWEAWGELVCAAVELLDERATGWDGAGVTERSFSTSTTWQISQVEWLDQLFTATVAVCIQEIVADCLVDTDPFRQLPAQVRVVWDQYQRAVGDNPDLEEATDSEIYQYFVERLLDPGEEEVQGEMTWCRYLRTARKALGKSKRKRRLRPATSRSIVSSESI